MSIYCGNNKNDPKLLNGFSTVGTNYKCLKKGIGIGSRLPYDPLYSNVYNPIDKRKFYCGTNKKAPSNYFAKGSPSICLRTGVGLGKLQKAKMRKEKKKFSFGFNKSIFNLQSNKTSIIYPLLVYVVVILILFILYTFLNKKDNPNSEIDKKEMDKVIYRSSERVQRKRSSLRHALKRIRRRRMFVYFYLLLCLIIFFFSLIKLKFYYNFFKKKSE
jgi:hypothetical protein